MEAKSTRHTKREKLSQTIYGEITKAYDAKFRCMVAIKLSRVQERKQGEDPLAETSILDKLWQSQGQDERPHLIKLLEKGTVQLEGKLYLCNILEYAEGGDMLDKVKDLTNAGRQMSLSRARRYMTQLAKGLYYIHERGVSHLDVSMENILITKEDELRLCDFGQAEHKHICSGLKGKQKYMSPEVAAASEEYDGFKADVWSAGIVLWAMLTGGLVYRTATEKDSRFNLLGNGRPGIEKLLAVDGVADLPEMVIDLLTHMLDMNPNTRYSIAEVLSHPWISAPPGSSPRVKLPPIVKSRTIATPASPALSSRGLTSSSYSSSSSTLSSVRESPIDFTPSPPPTAAAAVRSPDLVATLDIEKCTLTDKKAQNAVSEVSNIAQSTDPNSAHLGTHGTS